MKELVANEGIEYQAISKGALYLHRDPVELEAGIKKMALLAEHGQKQEILDASALARLEPAFEPVKSKIAGAIRDLGDSSGDSRVFSEELARVARDKHGLTVRLNTRVTALRSDGDRIDGVVTAIKRAGGSTDGATLAAKMQAFHKVPTLSGNVSFSASLHTVFGRQYRVIEINDNVPKLVGEVVAKVVPKI